MQYGILFGLLIALPFASVETRSESVSVQFTVTTADGDPLPCRTYLFDETGKAWHTAIRRAIPWGVICNGRVQFTVPPGKYRYEIEKGPEWTASSGWIDAAGPNEVLISARLQRISNLASEGWFGGDLHVHRPVEEMESHMIAEDLHIASVQTWWNETNPWTNRPIPENPVRKLDGHRFFHVLSGEDERGGGALLFHRMAAPIDITQSEREWPPSVTFLRAARRREAWVEIEKPFWRDTPAWLAADTADSVGVAHNHLHRRGVLGNEAWGRPRDPDQFPGIDGNGRYTLDLYSRILNSGFRIPPSAGSASGVLANPVGYNRVYVHCDPPLTWETWWEGFRAGRVFVSNGPLLRLTANGHHAGAVFETSDSSPLTVKIDGKLDSRDPMGPIELVVNGEPRAFTIPGEIQITESGWFLVRAVADVDETFRFASTGPWYVELNGEPMKPRRDAAEFFLRWARERRNQVANAMAGASESRRKDSLRPHDDAIEFWANRSRQP